MKIMMKMTDIHCYVEGLYDSPSVVVCQALNEGVLCQSDDSSYDDLEYGKSWEDLL